MVSAVRVNVPAACFELHRRRRNVRYDGAHRGLEFIGETNEFGAARRAAGPVLGILAAASRSALATACSLNSSTAPAISPSSSLRPSPGSTTSKLPLASLRIACTSPSSAGRCPCRAAAPVLRRAGSRRPRASRSAVRSGRWSHPIPIQVAADRRTGPPSSRRSPCMIAAAEFGHLGDQLIDRLGILDQLGQRLPVFREQPGASLRPATIFSSFDVIACSEFSTNLSRASALVATA